MTAAVPQAVPQGFTCSQARIYELRAGGIRNWDVKVLRRVRITEGLNSSVSVDLLKATNHTNFGTPNTDPTNGNFGRVTSQSGLAVSYS
jgi:hypothetical protein